MVTSYVPADPLLPDRSVLRGPRPVSDCSLLYHQWACHRIASLQAQVCALMDDESSCVNGVSVDYLCDRKELTTLEPDSFDLWPGID